MLYTYELVSHLESMGKFELDIPYIPITPTLNTTVPIKEFDAKTRSTFLGLISNRLLELQHRRLFSSFDVKYPEDSNSDASYKLGRFTLHINIHPFVTRNILFTPINMDIIYIRGTHYRNERPFYLKLLGVKACEFLELWAYT